MTFLTLGYHPDLAGGAYRYLADLAERLAERGHRIRVICPNPENRLPARELRRGVELLRFPNGNSTFAANWITENHWARDIYNCNRPGSSTADLVVLAHAYLAPALRGYWERSAFLFTGPWALEYRFARQGALASRSRRLLDAVIARAMHRTEGWALRRTRRILTISRYYSTELPRWHGNRLPSIEVISGGVDTDRFQPCPDRQRVREGYGVGPARFLWLAVRRLDPRMGLLSLLEGFKAVATEFPETDLWIAGQGPQRDELENYLRGRGLADRVRLLGFIEEADLPGLYNAADCTLMPSLGLEGLGLATLESLACGTPVLGSEVGATPELLTPLNPALLFPAGSGPAVAAKLRQVLSGRLPLPSRETCAIYARTHFRWDRPVAAFEEMAQHLPHPER